jgi:hypothetical protein
LHGFVLMIADGTAAGIQAGAKCGCGKDLTQEGTKFEGTCTEIPRLVRRALSLYDRAVRVFGAIIIAGL